MLKSCNHYGLKLVVSEAIREVLSADIAVPVFNVSFRNAGGCNSIVVDKTVGSRIGNRGKFDGSVGIGEQFFTFRAFVMSYCSIQSAGMGNGCMELKNMLMSFGFLMSAYGTSPYLQTGLCIIVPGIKAMSACTRINSLPCGNLNRTGLIGEVLPASRAVPVFDVSILSTGMGYRCMVLK